MVSTVIKKQIQKQSKKEKERKKGYRSMISVCGGAWMRVPIGKKEEEGDCITLWFSCFSVWFCFVHAFKMVLQLRTSGFSSLDANLVIRNLV